MMRGSPDKLPAMCICQSWTSSKPLSSEPSRPIVRLQEWLLAKEAAALTKRKGLVQAATAQC